MAQDLNKRFPLDTQLQSLWLPAIQSQLALNRKNLAYVSKAPQAASPIEFGQIVFVANVSCLYPVYVCEEGYLAAGQGSAAAAEFQKILDHSGIVWNCWTGALAHLGVARAEALKAKNLTGSGCQCRPRSCARRLQRFPHAMERRRPRYPHPEGSQGRVREVAVAEKGYAVLSDPLLCGAVPGWCSSRIRSPILRKKPKATPKKSAALGDLWGQGPYHVWQPKSYGDPAQRGFQYYPSNSKTENSEVHGSAKWIIPT